MGRISVAAGFCFAAAVLCQAVAAQSASPTASTPIIPVVGVQTGIDVKTGQRPGRQNINNLYARGGPQWDLYVLALSELQAVNETDALSYFAIAGIHGLPHSAWNGVEQVSGAPKNTGYCPHNLLLQELLFSTWHRAYVALFEQTLVSHALRIASQYPSSSSPAYQAAAQTLRQPYWDWASQPRLPTAAILANITVNGPSGVVTLRNPLYSYRFQQQSAESGFGGPLAELQETVRCLEIQGLGHNITASDEQMDSVAKDLINDVYDVFTRTQTFEDMAFDRWQGSSFENPHNIVHNHAGCGGTIGNIDWSAFDPIFMLHHCNVDRLTAMWQAIHYNHPMFTTTGRSTGQYATPKGALITADSPLKPFYDKNLRFHTSNTVSNTRELGYTYPEINDWSATPEEMAIYVRAQVNMLYGSDTTRVTARADSVVSQSHHQGKDNRPATLLRPQSRYYTAVVQVNRSEIPLPSTINLVISGFIVGRMSMLSMPSEGLASVSLPLRDVVVGNESLHNMDHVTAISFLQQNMTIDIHMNNGATVSVETAPSLQLEVQDMNYVAQLNNTGFPSFGNATRWPVRVRPSMRS
ncbi:hypothetical protein B0T25DRAFT_611078 [Lasiosphaeria hispida]|uniref:Tyrosinase copper-binding domain-containing protein n=1 Tax=Lasiosphaeria hispida TaxID=260671 RepID=A0AAJ0MD79_9PEZI|nr:hypothetical protein B0T25DRAFT_611078 [Lasiosphaeria hispida]